MTDRLAEMSPPTGDPALRAWLSDLVRQINDVLDTVGDIDHSIDIPTYPTESMMRFFPHAISGTEITYPGPWVYVDGLWRPMVSDTTNRSARSTSSTCSCCCCNK